MKCAEADHVRCCDILAEKIVGAATTLSSVSESTAEPEITTTDSVSIVKAIQETTEFPSDRQDEKITASADEWIENHQTELDTFETTTLPADDENRIAYVYGARNEDALRELAFDDLTTDGSIDENQFVTESTQSTLVSQDSENTESMTENDQVEIFTEAKPQFTTVDSVNEVISLTSTTERSIVQRTKDRVNNADNSRYTNYRHLNSEKSQAAEVQASNKQPKKADVAELSVANREPEVVTQTLEEIGTQRTLPSDHSVIDNNHGMMIMNVYSLISNYMKNSTISTSSHQELIPLTKKEHSQLNKPKQNGTTPVIQKNRRVYDRQINRFQIQTSTESNQENENVTQSELVTTRRPKYQRLTLPVRNSLQKTQSISTTISTPVTSIRLESPSSTVQYLKRRQYLQRRNPNGMSTTLRTNSNENLVTLMESKPMTENERKQYLTNRRKMLFAARRGPSDRNATITTYVPLDTDETAEKVIPVSKV